MFTWSIHNAYLISPFSWLVYAFKHGSSKHPPHMISCPYSGPLSHVLLFSPSLQSKMIPMAGWYDRGPSVYPETLLYIPCGGKSWRGVKGGGTHSWWGVGGVEGGGWRRRGACLTLLCILFLGMGEKCFWETFCFFFLLSFFLSSHCVDHPINPMTLAMVTW